MSHVTFTLPDEAIRHVQGDEGLTVMHAALEARIPGIDADCHGDRATCHVHFEGDWVGTLPAPSVDERGIWADTPTRHA